MNRIWVGITGMILVILAQGMPHEIAPYPMFTGIFMGIGVLLNFCALCSLYIDPQV